MRERDMVPGQTAAPSDLVKACAGIGYVTHLPLTPCALPFALQMRFLTSCTWQHQSELLAFRPYVCMLFP